jgi:hypothetical protein
MEAAEAGRCEDGGDRRVVLMLVLFLFSDKKVDVLMLLADGSGVLAD